MEREEDIRFLEKLGDNVKKGAINQGKETDHREDFLGIFGSWSEEDLKEFNWAAIDFEKIDPHDWK